MIKDQLKLTKFHDELLSKFGFPIFDLDIAKDEVDANASFFIYNDKGPIRKDSEGKYLLRDFQLMFVTKTNATLDDYWIISECNKWGLRFRTTEYDFGRMAETQEDVRTTTFYFHRVVTMCEGV